MAPPTGKCPGCDSEGVVGAPCDERACVKRGHHFIPVEYWDAAHQKPDSMIDPTIGQVVGDFLVVGFLGSGGFGKVFLSLQQPLLRLKGALKLLEFPSDNVMLTEALLEKFQGEAEALADLSHPNIVRLLKYGTHGERPYLVMEFVDQGATLRDEIWARARVRRNFTHLEIQHIIRQVLNGLEAAHEQAIIHRDIKPENIMLQKVVGNPHHVKILDFGTAKFVENRADTKWPLGSPSYMAPEQVGLKGIGPWSDLYAVGVVCFEMIIGKRPFVGETDNEIVSKKLDPDFDPLERVADMELPAALEAFFRKALEREPSDRYQNVGEFRSALYKAFEALAEEGRGALAEEGMELSDLVDSSDLVMPADVHDAETRRPDDSPRPDTSEPLRTQAQTRLAPEPVEPAQSRARFLWAIVAVVAVLGIVGVLVDPFAPEPQPVITAAPDAGKASPPDASNADAEPAVEEPPVEALAVETATTRLAVGLEAALEELAAIPPLPALSVGAGKFHTCVMFREAGTVRCWGNNSDGEIGAGNTQTIGDDEPASRAPELEFPDGVAQLAVSGDRDASFGCVRTNAGEVYCWGSNHGGQLGIGSTSAIGDDEPASAATAVPLGGKAVEIGVGAAKYGSHACARLEDGRVRCWGANNFGQLGYGHKRAIGDDEAVDTVGYVPLGSPAQRIWVGKFHNCAQLEGGVRCWGWNDHGQLGDGKTDHIGDNEVPASVPFLPFEEPIAEMALGRRHSCALTQKGEVYCWGWNNAGQLGYGHTRDVTDPNSGGPIALGSPATAVVAGGLHTCALLENGKVRCWGDNKFGQLGYGHTRDVGDDELPNTSGDIYLGDDAVGLAAGSYHTCAVLDEGRVRCWGYNQHGQLGYGHTDDVGDDEAPASAGDVPIKP